MPNVKSVNQIDAFVGARVRALREKRDMSQIRLAQLLGITFQQVQKYEKGTNRISASRLQHIGQILGVKVPYFFDGAPLALAIAHRKDADATDALALTEFVRSTQARALITAFQQIKAVATRRALVRMIEAMAAIDEAAN